MVSEFYPSILDWIYIYLQVLAAGLDFEFWCCSLLRVWVHCDQFYLIKFLHVFKLFSLAEMLHSYCCSSTRSLKICKGFSCLSPVSILLLCFSLKLVIGQFWNLTFFRFIPWGFESRTWLQIMFHMPTLNRHEPCISIAIKMLLYALNFHVKIFKWKP